MNKRQKDRPYSHSSTNQSWRQFHFFSNFKIIFMTQTICVCSLVYLIAHSNCMSHSSSFQNGSGDTLMSKLKLSECKPNKLFCVKAGKLLRTVKNYCRHTKSARHAKHKNQMFFISGAIQESDALFFHLSFANHFFYAPQLNRATVHNPITGKLEFAHYRISKKQVSFIIHCSYISVFHNHVGYISTRKYHF